MWIVGRLLMAAGIILAVMGYTAEPSLSLMGGMEAMRSVMQFQAGIGLFVAGSILVAAGDSVANLISWEQRDRDRQNAHPDGDSGYIPPARPRQETSDGTHSREDD